MRLFNFLKIFDKHQTLDGDYSRLSKYINKDYGVYHHNIILSLHKIVNFSSKRVLDIGGSNIPQEVFRELGAEKFVCIDPVSLWLKFHAANVDNYHMGKRVVKNSYLADDDFCYIVDACAEDMINEFENYFDVVLSFSTFEHVKSIYKTMNNIYKYLKNGGMCNICYEPVFSCAAGHHYYIDHDKYNFQVDRNIDFKHLLCCRNELRIELENLCYPPDVIDKIIYQVYDSDIINRKSFNDHIVEILNSKFNSYSIQYWNIMEVQPDVRQKLVKKYGDMRYDVRGIRVCAVK